MKSSDKYIEAIEVAQNRDSACTIMVNELLVCAQKNRSKIAAILTTYSEVKQEVQRRYPGYRFSSKSFYNNMLSLQKEEDVDRILEALGRQERELIQLEAIVPIDLIHIRNSLRILIGLNRVIYNSNTETYTLHELR